MDWNIREDLPIYSQLINKVKVAIVSGELKPGDRIPSVRDMAIDAHVNPNTMQRALGELEREGIVFTQRTNGRFVTEDVAMIDGMKETLACEQIASFLTSMEHLGINREQIVKLIESYKEESDN